MPTNREIVTAALSETMERLLWTTLFEPALPITPQDFELSGVLPAVMYMARFGKRRGAGRFTRTFPGTDRGGRPAATIGSVARVLAGRGDDFDGFDDETGRAILGDLLLTWCLENTSHAEGHDTKLARVYPTHYFAAWVDLPDRFGHLRGVPELITAMLADQHEGDVLRRPNSADRGRYQVGVMPSQNPLLAPLGTAIRTSNESPADLAADRLDEPAASDLGIDELIMARIASAIGQAPMPATASGGGGRRGADIPNRRPANPLAARAFREDILAFVRHFGGRLPHQTYSQLLECGFTIGLTQTILRSAQVLFTLEQTGNPVPEAVARGAWPLFVDCSEGRDRVLRHLAETSMTETHRRFERLPVVMMIFRIVYETLSEEGECEDVIPHRRADPTALLERLADAYRGASQLSLELKRDVGKVCRGLARKLREHIEEEPAREGIADTLGDDGTHPVARLAEALCELMGDGQQRIQFVKALDSATGAARPTGLADRRTAVGKKLARSIVMHTPMLDYLVHRHLVPEKSGHSLRHLSLRTFMDRIRDRHGLWIDAAPPGKQIPADILQRNKEYFEAHLRDLGLLVSVNDAETMKTIRSRY